MTVFARVTRYADWTASTVALLCSLGTLYLWGQALLWWGDANAYASAAVWTVLTLLMWGVVMVVEWLRERGE